MSRLKLFPFLFVVIFSIGCVALYPARQLETLGDEFAEFREHESALEQYQQAAKFDPANPDLATKIGWTYRRMEKNVEAMAQFKSVIARHPTHYEAYYGLYLTMYEIEENEAARTQLKATIKDKVKELLRQHKPTDKLYAMCYRLLKEIDESSYADQIKTILLREYPKSSELDDVGQVSFEDILAVGPELAKRAPHAEVFVREFPNHKMTDMAYRLALTYYGREAKDQEKVKQLCRQWLVHQPHNIMALATASRIYTEMEMDLSQAMDWAKECLQLAKDQTPKPFWYDEWQYRDAVRLFEVYDALGWAYYKMSDTTKAEQYLKRGLTLNGFQNRLWWHLAKIYSDRGDLAQSLNSYVRSLMARNDIPEVTDELKGLLTKITPGEDQSVYDKIYAELNQTFARQEGIPYFIDVSTPSGFSKAGGRRLSWGDYDNDGFQDLLVDGRRLWHNKGNGTFEEVTTGTKLQGDFGGGVWADYNNDGFLDIFSAGTTDALWKNNGDGTFTDVTKEVGELSDGFPSEGAAWGDYDRDGFVDLYVANYEKPGGQLALGTTDILWKNNQGKYFRDVSREVGIISKEPMCGRGVSWADYNNDGWLDIFVANYRLDPNFLWQNNGGIFVNVARTVGVEGVAKKGYFGHSIGADWGDYDNDGNLDLFIANLAHPRYIEFSNMSYLLKNQGMPDYNFIDLRQPSGLRYEETHSNPAWCDYDNDGLLDLYITSVYPERPSFLYRQDQNHHFNDVTWLTGTRLEDGWGCGWADYDNDGDMDLAVAGKDKSGHHIFLFRNETTRLLPKRNWVEIKLVGKDCNRTAIGGRITVRAGENKYIREVQGGFGTTCQNSLVQHFGLDTHDRAVVVTVRWPCGREETRTIPINQITIIDEK